MFNKPDLKVSGMIKKAICKNCGVVNEISIESLADESDDWLYCDLPTGFEWHLPAGKIEPAYGDTIYISGLGEHLSRDAYILKYDIDPYYALLNMRKWTRDRTVSKIANKEKKEPPKTVPAAATATRSHDLLDDDDWTS